MNIVVICLDTLRWDYLGCYGNTAIRTPAMDAFAQHAVRLDAAYCASFPTIPMRTDAFTGNVNWPVYGWKSLADDEIAITELLREAGYHTAFVHDTSNMEHNGFGEGFDENIFITPPEGWESSKEKVEFNVPRENMRHQDAHGYVNDRARTMHYRHETDWFVARTMMSACQWLEDNYKRDKFFLWVDTFEIHEDWWTPDYYTEYYSPDYEGLDYSYPNYGYTDIYEPHEIERLRARYAAEVTLTDRWVGQLLHQIETMRLLDNTVVMILSDHGMYLGEHRRMGKHTVNPEDAWPIYDQVGRIPWLIRLPGQTRSDHTAALVQPADLMPTVLDACDVPGPQVYGRSILPLLTGQAGGHHQYVFSSCHTGRGEGRIEYLPSCITVSGPRWTLVTGPQSWEPALHDRDRDPQQQQNLLSNEPDIAGQMREALVSFMRERGADEDYIREYSAI